MVDNKKLYVLMVVPTLGELPQNYQKSCAPKRRHTSQIRHFLGSWGAKTEQTLENTPS
jgi:hypothetical protein